MALTLTRGKTFGATEEVTNTKLHQLVDNATGADIDQSNMSSSIGVASRSSSAPSDTDGLWVDTSATPPVLRHYDGTEWIPSGPFALLTNKSGGTRAAGDVVIVDTANAGSYTTTTTANNQRAIGVVMASTANNADGLVAITGARVTNLAVTATTAVGDFLATSTTAGSAIPSSTIQAGTFAIALASRTGAGAIAEAVLVTPSYSPTSGNALAGSTVQVVIGTVATTSSGTTTLPLDDTIPQNTEGVEFLTRAITPSATTNRLIIIGNLFCAYQNTAEAQIALFQDSTANALSAATKRVIANEIQNMPIYHEMAAGTTSSTTFKLRTGQNGAGTWYLNSTSGGRLLGGALISTLLIIEVKV